MKGINNNDPIEPKATTNGLKSPEFTGLTAYRCARKINQNGASGLQGHSL